MANTRRIKARLKSVESISKVTKSMKMVSAAKLHHVQSQRVAFADFARKSEDALRRAMDGGHSRSCALLRPNGSEATCYVLFAGSRGLCGAYNIELLKCISEQSFGESDFLIVCGRWGRDNIGHWDLPVSEIFPDMSDTPTAADAQALSGHLKELYLSGQCGCVKLVYEKFVNVLIQTPTVKTLLPPELGERPAEGTDFVIFEPDKATLLDRAAELYFNNTVYSVLLDAKAGEHAARLNAMTSASDSTEKLIAELQLKLNHERQAAITTEIAEVSGGANALNRMDQDE